MFGRVGPDGFALGHHHFPDGQGGVGNQQGGQWQRSDIFIFRIDDKNAVSHSRQVRMATQISQHRIQCDSRSDGYHVGVHHPAGSILRIREQCLNLTSVLDVHRLQHLLGKLVWHLLENVDDIVVIDLFQDQRDLGCRLVIQQSGNQFFLKMLNNFALLFLVEKVEQRSTLGRR